MRSQPSSRRSGAWQCFHSLAKRLCSVSKSEVDNLRAKEAKAKKGKSKSDK